MTPRPVRTVAFVDDGRIFHHVLRRELAGHVELLSFFSPEELWLALDRDPDLLTRLALVITDLRFDTSSEDGTALACRLKRAAPDLPILLSTTGLVRSVSPALFTAVVDKTELSWSDIERFCDRLQS